MTTRKALLGVVLSLFLTSCEYSQEACHGADGSFYVGQIIRHIPSGEDVMITSHWVYTFSMCRKYHNPTYTVQFLNGGTKIRVEYKDLTASL